MKPETAQKILERIEDGCFTPDAVLYCGECKERGITTSVFELTLADVLEIMEQLVRDGLAEWRPQGRSGEQGRVVQLCVPKGEVAGNDYESNRPRGDEMVSGKGE